MARSVLRDKDYIDVTDKLAQTKSNSDKPSVFPTVKALLSFASLLGFDQSSKTELTNRGNLESIEWKTIEKTDEDHYIYLTSLADTMDTSILKYDIDNSSSEKSNNLDMVQIFEEYANGGLEIIRNWLNNYPTDTIGGEAILAGLEKLGYLEEVETKEEENFEEVEF